LKGAARLRATPDTAFDLELTPVDVAAARILAHADAALAQAETVRAAGALHGALPAAVVHVSDPRPTPWAAACALLSAATAQPLQAVSWDDWCGRARADAASVATGVGASGGDADSRLALGALIDAISEDYLPAQPYMANTPSPGEAAASQPSVSEDYLRVFLRN